MMYDEDAAARCARATQFKWLGSKRPGPSLPVAADTKAVERDAGPGVISSAAPVRRPLVPLPHRRAVT